MEFVQLPVCLLVISTTVLIVAMNRCTSQITASPPPTSASGKHQGPHVDRLSSFVSPSVSRRLSSCFSITCCSIIHNRHVVSTNLAHPTTKQEELLQWVVKRRWADGSLFCIHCLQIDCMTECLPVNEGMIDSGIKERRIKVMWTCADLASTVKTNVYYST